VVFHRERLVDGHRLYYQEAGPSDAPVVVLLHGYPTSSFMFRHLIPLLATRFRVIAPDHLGFGFSDAPPVEDFRYTFDALAGLTRTLLADLGVDRYAIYVQDYGAPIGWRLALADPDHVSAIVSQNGNAYDDGFVEEFWAPIWRYAQARDAGTEAELRPALEIEAIRWQYTHGVPDLETVDPETWHHDTALMSRPGNDQAQLALLADYPANVSQYPQVQQYFRDSQVPLLAIWGHNDQIFAAAGASAFARDLPGAQIELLDGGHFLLESHLDRVAEVMLEFLGRTIAHRAGTGRAAQAMPIRPRREVPIVVVPGWQGSGDEHWQTWLEQQLAQTGRPTIRPEFADLNRPDLAQWLVALRQTLASLPADGFDVVTHSLGAVLWLHHVVNPGNSPRPARVALVSPPSPGTSIAELAAFYPPPLSAEAVRHGAGGTVLVAGDDDPYLPEGVTTAYALPLEIAATLVPGGGHLSAANGYGPWATVLNWCQHDDLAF